MSAAEEMEMAGDDAPVVDMSIAESYAADPLAIWKQVCETDLSKTKHVGQRGGYTSIHAYYQLEQATKLFGPMGHRWGMRDASWEMVEDGKGKTQILTAEFYYPGGWFPMSIDKPFKANDDTRKKLITELLTKSLSYLGFNADIFQGVTDGNPYTNPGDPTPPTDDPTPSLGATENSPPPAPDPQDSPAPEAASDEAVKLTTELYQRALGRCKTVGVDNVEAVAKDLCSEVFRRLEVPKTSEAMIRANWDLIVGQIDAYNGPVKSHDPAPGTLAEDENAMRALHAWAANDVGAGEKAHDLLHDALPDGITSLVDLPLNQIGALKQRAKQLFEGN